MEHDPDDTGDDSEAISLKNPFLLILDPVSVPLLGHKSTKRISDGFMRVTSLYDLRSKIRNILAKKFQISLEEESFHLQYYDPNMSGFVDIERVQQLAAKTKLRLRLVPNIPGWEYEKISVVESLASARSVQNASVNLDAHPAAGDGNETSPQTARAAASVTPLGPKTLRDPEIEQFVRDLTHGIPVQKHAAKHGGRLPRILFCDSKCEMISWRAPQSESEKDHFNLLRGLPQWSKQKEALTLSSLVGVTSFPAAMEGAFLIRLSFDDRNLTFEAPNKTTCEHWIKGFDALIQEQRHHQGESSPVEAAIYPTTEVDKDIDGVAEFVVSSAAPRNNKLQEEWGGPLPSYVPTRRAPRRSTTLPVEPMVVSNKSII